MKSVFVDTNILIDFLADRPPFSKYAIELFDLAENKKVKLFNSSHSIATAHYILKKYIAEQELRNLLFSLLDYLTVISVDLSVIKESLLSKHKDFEDAIQITAAGTILGMNFIVTRNLKDFVSGNIPAFLPDVLLTLL